LIVKPTNPDTSDRPEAAGYFKIQDATTYTTDLTTDFAGWSGGATGIDAITTTDGKRLIYIAYGNAGVVKLDWTNLWDAPVSPPDTVDPILMEQGNTAGSATDVVVWNGRVYAADGAGGLVLFD